MKHPTASGIYAKICQVWRVRVWIVSLFLILIYIFIFRFKLVQKPEARFVKKVKMKWQPLQFAAIWYRKVPKRRIPGYSNIPTPLEKRPLSKSSWIFGLPKLYFNLPWMDRKCLDSNRDDVSTLNIRTVVYSSLQNLQVVRPVRFYATNNPSDPVFAGGMMPRLLQRS